MGLALATLPLSAAAQTQRADSDLNGAWEGELVNITGPGIAPPPNDFGPMRLVIDGHSARVCMREGAAFQEMKSDTFTVERNGTNAVISSIESDGGSRPGTSWVETWTFVVTLADADTLVVNYVRVVNNNNLRSDQDGAHFSQIRTGQFHRVHVDHV
jgi:hypothetical protein